MGLRILKPAQLAEELKERIIIYGRAGIGKSRLALSLTPRFGKIAYYAADTNTEFLSFIAPEKRERIVVVKPEGADPIVNFMQFCMQDWSEVDPEIGTLVIDTYTKVALDIISYSANTLAIDREKHYIVGDPKNGGQAIPNRGDYQGIESVTRGNLEMIFSKQRDKHIIFICHEDVKVIEDVRAVGGPAHPGRAIMEYLPAQFSTVIRLIREQILVPGADAPESVVIAITENDGRYIAKVRTQNETEPNPIAQVVVDRNPESYWRVKYDPIYAPQTALVENEA